MSHTSTAMCVNVCILLLAAITVTMAKVIDLSHDLAMDTKVGPPPMMKYNRTSYHQGNILPGIYAEYGWYKVAEHVGTHMDAPLHFSQGGNPIDLVPLEDTIVDGVMVDCSEEVAQNMLYKVTVDKLKAWEEVHGKIPDRAGVIFNFNWSSKYTDPKAYYNYDDWGNWSTYKNPYVGLEAGDWLVKQRNIKVIGVDIRNPDKWGIFDLHHRLLTDNRLIVENIKDPGRLPARGFKFFFTPVKFVGASGVQVRALALIGDPPNEGSRPGQWFVLVSVLALVSLLLSSSW